MHRTARLTAPFKGIALIATLDSLRFSPAKLVSAGVVFVVVNTHGCGFQLSPCHDGAFRKLTHSQR